MALVRVSLFLKVWNGIPLDVYPMISWISYTIDISDPWGETSMIFWMLGIKVVLYGPTPVLQGLERYLQGHAPIPLMNQLEIWCDRPMKWYWRHSFSRLGLDGFGEGIPFLEGPEWYPMRCVPHAYVWSFFVSLFLCYSATMLQHGQGDDKSKKDVSQMSLVDLMALRCLLWDAMDLAWQIMTDRTWRSITPMLQGLEWYLQGHAPIPLMNQLEIWCDRPMKWYWRHSFSRLGLDGFSEGIPFLEGLEWYPIRCVPNDFLNQLHNRYFRPMRWDFNDLLDVGYQGGSLWANPFAAGSRMISSGSCTKSVDESTGDMVW